MSGATPIDRYRRGIVSATRQSGCPGRRDRSLFAPGLRSLNYKRHVIFLARIAAADDESVILRIVHRRRNMPALVYLGDLAG